MRISCDTTDSGYEQWRELCRHSGNGSITVLLNGEPVSHPITADEELGFVAYFDGRRQESPFDYIVKQAHGDVVIQVEEL